VRNGAEAIVSYWTDVAMVGGEDDDAEVSLLVIVLMNCQSSPSR